jgi:hypothetical protein
MSKGKVLVIGSNATRIEITRGRNRADLNETVVPMLALVDAGYEVLLATPSGEKPHIDEVSDSIASSSPARIRVPTIRWQRSWSKRSSA